MTSISRRSFLKTGAMTAALAPLAVFPGRRSTLLARTDGSLLFKPKPHSLMQPLTFAYASDPEGDPFPSPIKVGPEGITVPDAMGDRRFAVNARWYVEGFGHVWLGADNGGRYYSVREMNGNQLLSLNHEFARSRVARNAEVRRRYEKAGTSFSTEVKHLVDLSEELLEDAVRKGNDSGTDYADAALLYALWAGEKIELEKAASDIEKARRADPVWFGCETRQYIWAKSETMVERFTELFNYATVTHYVWDSWYEVFEPEEGKYRWGIKDNIVDWLTENGITVEGRPLFWFHPTVTPDWLKNKTFDDLKRYAENHVRQLVGHYGDRVLHWEVVNEYHDWANIHNHTPEQITEIVRLACDKTHEVNPKVERLINNCCPFGEYVSYNHAAHGDSNRPLRTPRQFVRDLIDAEVPFEVLGVQVYFPQRDLSEIVRLIERFETFGKPVYITEMAASSGPTRGDITSGEMKMPGMMYDWHRPWDEELQADWLEQVYSLYYSRSRVKGILWYDFADFRTFIPNGGLIKVDGTAKLSFDRLKGLLQRWGRLPEPVRKAG